MFSKKRKFDSLGNPIKDEEVTAVPPAYRPTVDEGQLEWQPENRKVSAYQNAEAEDELYKETFSPTKLTAAEYLESLKKLPEDTRREKWNKLTTEQKTELKALATGAPTQQQIAATKIPGSYWLLPFFFGIIGGIIGWSITKDKNPETGKGMLAFGFVWGIMEPLLFWALFLAPR